MAGFNLLSIDSRRGEGRRAVAGELWGGTAALGGNFKVVKAYRRALATAEQGIEFVTQHAPASGHGTPFEARWLHCQDVTGAPVPDCCAAVFLNGQGYAVLPIIVTKAVP
jgi:hypothetical protein